MLAPRQECVHLWHGDVVAHVVAPAPVRPVTRVDLGAGQGARGTQRGSRHLELFSIYSLGIWV